LRGKKQVGFAEKMVTRVERKHRRGRHRPRDETKFHLALGLTEAKVDEMMEQGKHLDGVLSFPTMKELKAWVEVNEDPSP